MRDIDSENLGGLPGYQKATRSVDGRSHLFLPTMSHWPLNSHVETEPEDEISGMGRGPAQTQDPWLLGSGEAWGTHRSEKEVGEWGQGGEGGQGKKVTSRFHHPEATHTIIVTFVFTS